MSAPAKTLTLEQQLAKAEASLRYREGKVAAWSRQVEAAKTEIARLKREIADRPVPAKGIDVSNLQGHVDFAKVKAAGYRFLWLKAGEGDWKDPLFLGNVKAAKAAGLKVGGYHWLIPRTGRTGAQEAAFFLARLKEAGLGKGDLRPVLDCEDIRGDGKTRPLITGAALRTYIGQFVRAMRATGHDPLIYTGAWWWTPNIGRSESFGCDLWISHYTTADSPTLPPAWKSWAAWQYSSNGVVPGVSGVVDMNRTDDLRRLLA